MAVLMLTLVSGVNAQVTTSSMGGMITDSQDEPVIGATVRIVHEPSGTQYNTVTNMNGQYSVQGMRVGGPYKVTISYLGSTTQTFTGVTLQLGETYRLNAKMKENADMLEEVVVTGKQTKFHTMKTGAATNITSAQITSMPTVNRSITELTRLSPYGGNGMTFAGSDGRTANFTVDGADFNNNFGLSDGLPGGGNPISLDAIEEAQVVISPYDVRQTNFIGGGVNAITKSGTNTFKGTAYVYHKNENMMGDAIYGEQIAGAREKSSETTYGFTFGGPILKDKLFFFANYEEVKIPTVANRWRASENGVADPNNYISRTTLADMQKVSEHVMNKYGYDTGSWTNFPADKNNRKILARLDWNITNNHHLALRYNHTLNKNWMSPNATSMDGGTRASGARMSQYSMAFANSMYSLENKVNSWSLDLNSRFGEKLSNQLLATYSQLDDVRGTDSSDFPFIDIQDGAEQNYMALGYELFTYNNGVHNKVYNVRDDITYYTGAHKITAGISYEHQMADNSYMRNGTGYYRYRTLDDFLTGATPEVVCLTYGYGGEANPAARVTFNKLGLYLQDVWQATDKFSLTGGIRFDNLMFDNGDLMTNQAILDLDYNGRRIDTGKWPKNGLTVSPRIGFSYDVLGDKSLVVRGGTGLFSGRLPLVFFTNMPTNGGMVQYQAQINAENAAKKGFDMSVFNGGLVKNEGMSYAESLKRKLIGLGYPGTISPEDGTVPSSISGVVDNFKMPQVWKTSIAVDYSLPVSFPLTVTGELIMNKTVNDVCISDWSVPNVGGFARFNGVDNRPIYPEGYRTGTKAFMLDNTSKGYGWMGSLTVNARPTDNISLMASYTHSVKKEVTSMPGNNAESAFTYVPTVEGPNNIRLHNAINTTPDRFIFSGTVNDKSGNSLSLIYETWRGGYGYNYSFMTTNDMNGDGYAYDALYIPTDEQVRNGEFRFVSQDDADRFMDYVHSDSYLKNHQGEYAEAYSVYSPWVHRVDIAYKHDFKVKTGNINHKLQLGFDIKNVLNLFNNKWGVAKYLNPEIGSEARILKYEGVDKDGFATFSTPAAINGNTKTFAPNHAIGQCWYMSVGIKYFFN